MPLFIIYGCHKSEVRSGAKPAATIQNLQTAYAKAVTYVRRYTLFVQQAEKERNAAIASLCRAVARSEEIRAGNHARLLRSFGVEPVMPPEERLAVGTTAQTLKMALSCEDVQYDEMYPGMIRTAAVEKDSAAARQFKMAREVDARHRELFFDAINQHGRVPRVEYLLCPGCGYVFDSDKSDECPVCHLKKESFVKV
jgi:rubrerythrin